MKLFLFLSLVVASESRLTGGDNDKASIDARLLGNPNNEGDDNNGETTLSEKFVLFATSDADTCFDKKSFCDYVYLNAYQYASDNAYGAAQADSYAWFHRDVGCEAAAMALAEAKAFLSMEGEFQVTRHGNNGAVTSVDLTSSIQHSQIALVHSEAFVNNTANAEAHVYANGRTSQACRYTSSSYSYGYYYRQYLCAYASSYSSGGTSDAFASSYGSSNSTAQAGGQGGQALGVHVEGKNLQSFHATVVAGASNFVAASSSSAAEAVAEAYMSAYANAYARVCTYYQKRYIYSSYWSTYSTYCSSGSASANGNARALAKSFADAVGEATANTQYSALIQADFVNEKGNEDTFSLLGDGFATASAIAHCSAN